MRNIRDILAARRDISPFLVHLTRQTTARSAKEGLVQILSADPFNLARGALSKYSSFNYVDSFPDVDRAVIDRLQAVSFSETPLDEIHCLIDIQGRSVNLSQFGLILLKQPLVSRHRISPVLYISTQNEAHRTAYLAVINELYTAALARPDSKICDFMVYFESFGPQLRGNGNTDFYWEREWRSVTDVTFTTDDVFLGLCPETEIADLEARFRPIRFIDPKMNPRYFSTKILARKEELNLKFNLL